MLFLLRTEFTLSAPRQAVYDAVHTVTEWPQWWRGCERVAERPKGQTAGVGARHRIEWLSRLPDGLDAGLSFS